MKIRVSLIVLLALVAALLLLSESGRAVGHAVESATAVMNDESGVIPVSEAALAVAPDPQTVPATDAGGSDAGQGSAAGPALGQSGSPAGESETPAAGELEEFVPSERVPADSAISFPVDI